MLDVHPPHESVHTWKGFFIHIATIVIGLIIAVGLEQAVELIHHHRQRHELLESLKSDTITCAEDGRNMTRYSQVSAASILDRERRIEVALWSGKQLSSLPDFIAQPPAVILTYTHFEAAKASGLLQLLSTEDMDAFSDVYVDVENSLVAEVDWASCRSARRAFEAGFFNPASSHAEFSKASTADLREYLRLLERERIANLNELERADEAEAAASAVSKGVRGIRNLEQAEYAASRRHLDISSVSGMN